MFINIKTKSTVDLNMWIYCSDRKYALWQAIGVQFTELMKVCKIYTEF